MAALELDLEAYKLLETRRERVDESQLEILKRCLKNEARAQLKTTPGTDGATAPSRQTGHFSIRVGNRATITYSQKSAYKQIVLWLAERDGKFLEQLSSVRIRSRRIVARSREALYRRPELTRFAEPLCEGWYIDLNLSKQQKLARLKEACNLAGLILGRDVEPGFR